MKRVTGGFMCAMNNCNENSGVNDHHLSFFRFPSHPERYCLTISYIYVNFSLFLKLQ